MSDDEDLKRESIKDSEFIRQKIVNQKQTMRQKIKKILALICMAIIFGGVSCLTFVWAKPWIELHFDKPEETVPVTIPPDEMEDPSGETAITSQGVETEPIEEIVQSAIEQNELDKDDYMVLQRSLSQVASQADKSIVTVNAVNNGTDWFENTFQHSGKTAGIIVAKTNIEILIMTRADAISEADAIEITLSPEKVFPGTLKQSDSITNLAIISVAAGDINKEFLEGIVTIPLGNSHLLHQGDPLIMIGNPTGAVHSISYGSVCYIRKDVQIVDGSMRIIETDSLAEGSSSCFLINLAGELVAVMNNTYKSDSSSQFTSALAISDLKELIEKMENGHEKAYLGVKGQEITESISVSTGIPVGIYVQEAVDNGAAYSVGIQSGDIITAIGNKEITTLKELQNQLAAYGAGDVILVKIQRGGKEEYKEINFEVTLYAR